MANIHRSFIARAIQSGIIALAALFAISAVASAELNAQQTVEQLLGKLQKSGSLTEVLEYVHWPTAYKNLTPEQSRMLEVGSPQALRSTTENLLKNPGKALTERLTSRFGNVAPEQKAMIEQMLSQQTSEVNRKIQDAQAQMKRAQYKILKTQEQGATATVLVQAEVDGKVDQRPIQMSKIDGRWYLSTSNMSEISGLPGVM